MLYILIILWAYVAIVLALVAGELDARSQSDGDKVRLEGRKLLKTAALLFILAPLLVYAATIDWYGDVE